MRIIERISARGATIDEISKLEGQVGFAISDDFRNFLQHENGGRPQPNQFEGPDGEGSVVHFFFTLDPDADHYQIAQKIATYTGRIPEGTLPIGCDPFGNLILLDGGAKSIGAVYFWDHEEENFDGDPHWDNISYISASFSDFIASLH